MRQVAADLGVNLNTVAFAYRTLQAEGLIKVRHGSGAIVTSRVLGEQASEQLDFRPAKLFVWQHVRLSYACPACLAKAIDPVPDGEPVRIMSSGKEPLDRAAVSAIRSSNPFEPLPPAFSGPFIELRFIFLYNLPIEAAYQ